MRTPGPASRRRQPERAPNISGNKLNGDRDDAVRARVDARTHHHDDPEVPPGLSATGPAAPAGKLGAGPGRSWPGRPGPGRDEPGRWREALQVGRAGAGQVVRHPAGPQRWTAGRSSPMRLASSSSRILAAVLCQNHLPSVPVPAAVDLDGYIEQLFQRWSNTAPNTAPTRSLRRIGQAGPADRRCCSTEISDERAGFPLSSRSSSSCATCRALPPDGAGPVLGGGGGPPPPAGEPPDRARDAARSGISGGVRVRAPGPSSRTDRPRRRAPVDREGDR